MLTLILPLLFLTLQTVLTFPRDELCSLEFRAGNCREKIQRWYYDKDAKRCLQFSFTGCGGNANSFESERECAGTCGDICNLQMDNGYCMAHFLRYAFNKTSGRCETFVYGGCGGNDNNFRSFEKCRAVCQNECMLPSETGLCRASISRYYYNKDTGNCEMFIYGGCSGNANNFDEKKDCEARCVITNTTA